MSAPLAIFAVAALVPAVVQSFEPMLARRLRVKRSVPVNPRQFPALSVLVPVCGDEPGLEAGLIAVLHQEWPGPGFELIVIAARADDPALAVARRAIAVRPERGRAIVASVPAGEPGKALQLAAGAAVAHGDWLVLLDSDARLPDFRYLRRFCEPLGDPAIGLVGCLPVMTPARAWPSRALAATLEPDLLGSFAMLDAFGALDVASGACLAIRTDTLTRSGGLEAMRGRLLMDTALARAVRRAGGGVAAHGEPLPLESGERGWGDVLGQSHRWLAAILRGLPLPAAIGFAWLRSGTLLALVLLAVGDPTSRLVAALALAARLASALALRHTLGATLTLSSAPLQLLVDAAAGATWLAAAVDPRVTWRGRKWRVGRDARLAPRDGAS